MARNCSTQRCPPYTVACKLLEASSRWSRAKPSCSCTTVLRVLKVIASGVAWRGSWLNATRLNIKGFWVCGRRRVFLNDVSDVYCLTESFNFLFTWTHVV